MRKRLLLLILLFVTCFSGLLLAQDRVIKGKITADDGSVMPGANVAIKGTSIGASTNAEGMYSLSIPVQYAKGTLVFSFIGMKTEEVAIGSQTAISVVLKAGEAALAEVVVTALGFKESRDKQGATAVKIDAKDIIRSGETGIINGMSGKAAGVLVTRSAGDPGAGSYIQIRGQNTITGSTQPLVIVDGIPISNATLGDGAAGVTQQSRLNDLNPDDIASMQVLKGASAAALWGSRAANGVIVITTKRGAEGKVNISFGSTVSFDEANRYHPLHETYGQGAAGKYDPNGSFTWGDKISTRSGAADVLKTDGEFFKGYDGVTYYPILTRNSTETYHDERRADAFRTGTYIDNNLSISGGNDKGTFYLSLSDLRQKGILNGQSDYNRSTVRFNSERKFSDIIRATTNATYARTTSNRVQRSNSINGLYIGMLRTPPDFDSRGYKGDYYSSPTASPIPNRQRTFRRYLGNSANPVYNDPLWAINELTNSSEVDRFILSSDLVISPTSWFDLTARAGIDSYTDLRVTNYPISSAINNGLGSYEKNILKETEMNVDVIGRFNRNLTDRITSTLVLGFNVNDRKYLSLGGTMNTFIIPDAPPNFSNSLQANDLAYTAETHRRTARMYSTLNLGFYEQLFLNLSLAGESGSTFGSAAKSTFYYPSGDLAWQFTQLPALSNSQILTFGKLRASYGIVGVQPDAYRNTTTFINASFGSWGGPASGSGYGNGAFVRSARQGDPFLKPERKTEWELGTDLRFFNNRLTAGFTYYQNKIVDLLLDVAVAGSTGYTQKYTNAGSMTNKGMEVELNYNILPKSALTWNVFGNWSRNINRVTDLAGTDIITLGGFSSTASTVAKTGYAMSALYGGVFLRNPDNTLKLNENGFPQIAPSFGVIGDPNPDWRGGFGTNLAYKGVSLNILFETFQGGDFYTGTQGVLYHFGTHEDVGKEVTLSKDLKNYAGKIIPAGTTVRGNLGDFGGGQVLLDEAYYTSIGGGFSTLVEQFIKDGSWTRLREVSLGYSLKTPAFRKKTKLQSVDFTMTGRNPILWTKIVGVDPETALNGASNSRGQDYFNSPNTKSLVFSIKVNY